MTFGTKLLIAVGVAGGLALALRRGDEGYDPFPSDVDQLVRDRQTAAQAAKRVQAYQDAYGLRAEFGGDCGCRG